MYVCDTADHNLLTSTPEVHSNECWLATRYIYSAFQVLIHISNDGSEHVDIGSSIEWRVYAYSTISLTGGTAALTACKSTIFHADL